MFHLWWKQNLVNYQKVSKYYDHDCSSKIHALARVALYMNIKQRREIMNVFVNSQFGYCLLIWMFYGRMANNKTEKLHERCLWIIYNHKSPGHEEPLEKDSSVSLHQRNLHILSTEMFKVAKDIYFPEIMKQDFHFFPQGNINLRQAPTFYSRRVNSVHCENSLAFFEPKTFAINKWSSLELLNRKMYLVPNLGAFQIKKCPNKMCFGWFFCNTIVIRNRKSFRFLWLW